MSWTFIACMVRMDKLNQVPNMVGCTSATFSYQTTTRFLRLLIYFLFPSFVQTEVPLDFQMPITVSSFLSNIPKKDQKNSITLQCIYIEQCTQCQFWSLMEERPKKEEPVSRRIYEGKWAVGISILKRWWLYSQALL